MIRFTYLTLYYTDLRYNLLILLVGINPRPPSRSCFHRDTDEILWRAKYNRVIEFGGGSVVLSINLVENRTPPAIPSASNENHPRKSTWPLQSVGFGLA